MSNLRIELDLPTTFVFLVQRWASEDQGMPIYDMIYDGTLNGGQSLS